ncbi:nucleotide exchange factor GrpE [Rubrobacter indicoceani]|uniref:nucleotide exchange factor GrpE n=1 Tax=Rubrobacter indicoceani TaxID=2051957 RepID=UPI0013C51C01|nr:nucleotide exchange factor GrpE [Rubrobacter indicoceani]
MSTEENNREPEAQNPGKPEPGTDAEPEANLVPDEVVEEAEVVDREPAADEVRSEARPEDDPAARLEEVEAQLEQTTRERDEYLDSMLRLRAEFDNSRKRLERERERILQTASERILVSLLPVLDNLDRALESEGDVREGVRATRDQLVEVLDNEGLLPVESDGEHFDPNIHEAVMSQPSDEHEEGTVLQTFERGYLLNGRTVRVAKVVVAQ